MKKIILGITIGLVLGILLAIYAEIGWEQYSYEKVCMRFVYWADSHVAKMARPFCLPDSFAHPNPLAPWYTRGV